MPLDPAVLTALAIRCAPHVAPATLLAVARAESGLDPLAVGVNRGRRPASQPRTLPEAVSVASRLLAAGADVDLGLGQINSRNLTRLGLSVEAAFDPCRNLRASADVLAGAYAREWRGPADSQPALRRALSIYNTGHPARGLRNGYVARVEAAARITPTPVPAITAPGEPPAPLPPRPSWAVFGGPAPSGFVVTATTAVAGTGS